MPNPILSYHNVSRETFQKIDVLIDQFHPVLEAYILRLMWWNRSVNLVSRNVTLQILREHVRHSLFPSLLTEFTQSQIILDAGSGGGLPGIPLTLCFDDKKIFLNDISSKKTTVLSHLKRELGITNSYIVNYPISEYPIRNPGVDCIVSKHAFKLPDLLMDIHSGNWKSLILLKGDDFRKELKNIPYPVSVECFELGAGTDHPFYQGKVMLNIHRI